MLGATASQMFHSRIREAHTQAATIRTSPLSESSRPHISARQPRILLTLATGTGQRPFHRISSCVETISHPLEFEPQAVMLARSLCFWQTGTFWLDQAYNTCAANEDSNPGSLVIISPDDIRKKGKVPKSSGVFLHGAETFMSGPEKDGKPSSYFVFYPRGRTSFP